MTFWYTRTKKISGHAKNRRNELIQCIDKFFIRSFDLLKGQCFIGQIDNAYTKITLWLQMFIQLQFVLEVGRSQAPFDQIANYGR